MERKVQKIRKYLEDEQNNGMEEDHKLSEEAVSMSAEIRKLRLENQQKYHIQDRKGSDRAEGHEISNRAQIDQGKNDRDNKNAYEKENDTCYH